MDPQPVLVTNLCETLRQLQRYLVLAIVASLSLVVLQLLSSSESAGRVIQLPGLVTTVDVRTAKLLLVAAHMAFGLLTLATGERARKTFEKIHKPELRDAALSYPSIATEPDPFIRVSACLAPALLFLIMLVLEWSHQQSESAVQYYIFAIGFGVIPFVLLVTRVQFFAEPSTTGKVDAAGTG